MRCCAHVKLVLLSAAFTQVLSKEHRRHSHRSREHDHRLSASAEQDSTKLPLPISPAPAFRALVSLPPLPLGAANAVWRLSTALSRRYVYHDAPRLALTSCAAFFAPFSLVDCVGGLCIL
eukprot:4542781-Pleurochrysis_carterae.AAC.2